jgi:two-component system response regulator YesN
LYNLLVVDDEEIAIRGIVKGIDWSELPIANIYTAYDAEEAQELLREHTIHVMLSDIDMPNQSGIDLLGWVNEHSPHSVTIFLTGHADFTYAQQAVQLDCFDYLLKPIDHGALRACVNEALDKVRESEQWSKIRATYERFHEQWSKQRPLLLERLWQDMLHYRISSSPARLDAELAYYGLPLTAGSGLRAVLVSIEQWREEWSARDEEIMTYGVKNAAEELVLQQMPGHVIQDGSGVLYVLFYETADTALIGEEEAAARCRVFIAQCNSMLHCRLSCYVGKQVTVGGLRAGADALLELERSNVSLTCAVLMERDRGAEERASAPQQPRFADWALLLESGKQTELALRIDEWFDHMQASGVDYSHLAAFYYGYMHMLFGWLNGKQLPLADVFPKREWEAGEQVLRSLPRLRAWAQQTSAQAMDYTRSNGKDVSQVVEKVQKYMLEHLGEEFSRETLAEQVYLNPAYLSRLFRRETGFSLTDYLVRQRVDKARAELEQTNQRVSDIAADVGYANFSHFSKLFKKMTGLTPQEYRKKYQKL